MNGTVKRPAVSLACMDLAGTTVVDNGLVERAFASALDDMGIRVEDPQRASMTAYVRQTMGRSKIEVFRDLFGSETVALSANAAFEFAFDRIIRSGAVRPIDGARQVIDRLRSAGVKVALTTGFSASTRQALLDALGWLDTVDLALSPGDAGRGRPYPDMVLTALLRLGVDAVTQVAVVGDTASDMESGRRAGASVVAGVLTGADGRDRLATAGATAVIESVADFPALIGLGTP